MPISQMRGLAARAAQNFDYYAGVITELHGRSFQVGDEFLNYTIHKPVGVAGLIMPWNAPLMLSTWRIAPALAAGNTVVLEAGRVGAALLDAARRGARERGPAERRLQRRARLRRDGGRPALRAPRRQPDLLHGRDLDRQSRDRRGRADAQALLGRARRQVAGRRLRGRRSRPRGRRRAGADLHDERPALHGGLAPARAAAALRAHRQRRRRARAQHPRRRSVRSAHRARPADHDPSTTRACSSTSPRRAPTARASSPAASARPLPERGNFLAGDRDRRRRRVRCASSRRRSSGPCSWRCRSTTRPRPSGSRTRRQYGLAAYVWTNDIRRAHRVAHAIDTGMCWINSQNVRDLRTPFGGVKSSRHRPRGRRLRVRLLLRSRDRARRARLAPHPEDGTRRG